MKLKINFQWRTHFFHNGFVLLISIIGIATHDFNPSDPTFFSLMVSELVSPLQSSATSMSKNVKKVVDNYLLIVATRSENEFLRFKLEELKDEIFRLSSLAKENERLKSLLSFGEQISYVRVLGQVIGWDANSEYKMLKIDKGSNDGIRLKSAVITSQGLVGYTYKVFSNYTEILTILDSNNRVDVLIDRTRTHGIIEGISQMTCRMKYVSRNENLIEGDLIITAGLGMLYPKGLKVGTVEKIEKDSQGLTMEIEVKPAVDFTKLEEVVVLIK